MNKDTRLAIILAPFLLVGGYIVSDQYLASKSSDGKMFALALNGKCAPFTDNCILQSGDMQINITDVNGTTKANTSYPSDTVAISLVYKSGKEIIYGLEQAANPQYWQRQTDIRSAFTQQHNAEKMRVVVQVKGNTYLTEFTPEDVSR